jgi:hypothetical protein
MLPYARTITFQPEYRLPQFTIAQLYGQQEERLLNNNGQFFVHVSEKNPYLKELVRQAQNLNLTVSGDGTNTVKGGDITQAQKGDQITFGTSSRFDVNWTKRDQYFCQKGYAPVYDIVKDWNKIEKAMKQFANQKKVMNTVDGTNIRFHARFMVVDGRVVSYDNAQIACLLPATVVRDIMNEYTITINVQRNW